MKKLITILLVVAVAFLAARFLLGQKKAVAELGTPQPVHYHVLTEEAREGTVRETRRFLAQLLSDKSAMIASKYSGRIKHIHVKENDRVKKGALLVTLDDSEVRSSIASLRSQEKALLTDVANAKTQLDRSALLLESGGLSQDKYDNAVVLYENKKAALQGTREKIRQLQSQLAYFNLRAPFAGKVGSLFADDGSLAVPGKPILSINSGDQKLVFSYVETDQRILEGQTVLFEGEPVGRVVRLYDDAKNALLVAEAAVTKPLGKANKSYLNIDVVTAEARGCTVPQDALLHRHGKTYVMEYRERHFEAKEVEVLLQDTERALLETCPAHPVATASEAKLALLPTMGSVKLGGGE
jgi:RND family efflux transporter MFP subunit